VESDQGIRGRRSRTPPRAQTNRSAIAKIEKTRSAFVGSRVRIRLEQCPYLACSVSLCHSSTAAVQHHHGHTTLSRDGRWDDGAGSDHTARSRVCRHGTTADTASPVLAIRAPCPTRHIGYWHQQDFPDAYGSTVGQNGCSCMTAHSD